MKQKIIGLLVGLGLATSLAWAVGPTPFQDIILRDRTANRIIKVDSNKETADSLLSDDGTNVTLTSGQFLVPAGTGLLPAIGFSTEANLGFYRVAAGRLGVAVGNTLSFEFQTTASQDSGSFLIKKPSVNQAVGLLTEGTGVLQVGTFDATTLANTTIKAADILSTTDIAAGALRLSTGSGRGNAVTEGVEFLVSQPGSSGTGAQTVSEVGSVVPGGFRLEGNKTIEFEGATADDFETTITVTDPTADRTLTLPNASGTFALVDGNIGAATATSPAASDDDTSVATTEWVQDELAAAGSGGDSITVNGSAAADANFLDGDITWTLDTGPTPDTITGTVAANSVALGTDTTGDYVSDVTANQGLLKTGTEGATLGFIDCAANEILKRNAGDTAWECAADAGAAGGDSITVNGAAVTDPDFIDGDIEFDVATDDITATIGANGVDAITDLDASIRTGSDTKVVTGTAGATDECAKWNADGDLVSAGAACGVGGGAALYRKEWTANQAIQAGTGTLATLFHRNGHVYLIFPDAADNCTYFHGRLDGYTGGGLDFDFSAMTDVAGPTGSARIEIAIESLTDDADDADADSFATAQVVAVTGASASGERKYFTAHFDDGAEMDSLADGEDYRIQFCRDGDGTGGTDDLSGSAQVQLVNSTLSETP